MDPNFTSSSTQFLPEVCPTASDQLEINVGQTAGVHGRVQVAADHLIYPTDYDQFHKIVPVCSVYCNMTLNSFSEQIIRAPRKHRSYRLTLN